MPAERVAVDRVLALEVLRAVLPHHLDPGFREHGHVLERDVLRRRDDRHVASDLGANALVRGADGLRRHVRSLPARRAASRCGGARRRAPGCTTCRGRRARPPRRPPRAAPVRPRSRGRGSGLAARPARMPRANGSGHLGADLVAAGPDRGPDRRMRTAPERGHAFRDDARQKAAPARVQDGDSRPAVPDAGKRDRQAVGAHREHGQIGLLRPEPVAGLAARTWLGAVDEARVDLPVEREPVGVRRRPPRRGGDGSRRPARRRRRSSVRGSATRTALR